MTSDKLLDVDYLTPDELANCRGRTPAGVLGMSLYGGDDALLETAEVPVARIASQPLGGVPALCEVWRAKGPLVSGRIGLVQYRASKHFAFGCATLREAEAEAGGAALTEATTRAYGDVFRCLKTLGFTGALRIWNYLADINREVGGIERYRVFNAARQRAFLAANCSVRGNVPAACALGLPAGSPLVVYFIAATDPGTAIENPRQVPAYDYPAEYGACSPTFSRAMLTDAASGPMLFVSGTASIVGHRTVHSGDVIAQTRETVTNIRALVAEANRVTGAELFTPGRLRYKAYVRRPGDLAAVAKEIATVEPTAPVVYLNADVCRAGILAEIEAVGGAGASELRRP
jgi:chorismate lyase / 3-hydroxybenzoate synthase